ncbi:alpha-L-fucosidase [Pedobacter changchengzhani]|nr:alpha-L-fucosidase [Pedobacter changchengzhani]
MNSLKVKVLLVFMFFGFQSFAQELFQPNWKSLKTYTVPDWFRDAKFGIFIHWGVYSVPAYGGGGIFGEWYGNDMYQKGSAAYKHHIETYGTQDKFGYKDFIPMFKGEKFDADAWAKLFKKAGAKYVVPVAEHHDGFAMYDTKLSKWNSVNMGPKRDVIGELSTSIRKEGMIFGLSSHRAEHWYFYHNGRDIKSDVNDPKFDDLYGPAATGEDSLSTTKISPVFLNDWLLRNTELVDKYKPQLFWFDWWLDNPSFQPYLKSFAAYYYNAGIAMNKGVVLNYKNTAFPDSAAVIDFERDGDTKISKLPWQSDDSVGDRSWGYIEDDHYKTPQFLIDGLIDIVSKNGNLLLNIGPKADGTIPEVQQHLLLEMGKWLDVNGEAIYGTRPWKIFGEGPGMIAAAEKAKQNADSYKPEEKEFTAQDFRFTTKGDDIFAIALKIPTGKIILKSFGKTQLKKKVTAIKLLGSSKDLKWKQTNDALVIDAVGVYPSEYAASFQVAVK